MDFFSIGDKLGYDDLNSIVYLLRKFKRLTSDLRIASTIESDYGTYTVSDGLTSVGGNYILEDDVTITSSDVLLNCFYTFHFTVVDVNLSGTVNRRVVSVTGDTGDDGVLTVVLPVDSLESDEQILPDFKVDIVFDPHEYYTPIAGLNLDLSVDNQYIEYGETATVTAVFTTESGTAMEGLTIGFDVNGVVTTKVTDENGEASITYTGTGNIGKVTVTVGSDSIVFFDGRCLIAEVTGDSIKLGGNSSSYSPWLSSTGDTVIDWGDGTTSTVNNPKSPLTHNYTDSETNHTVKFIGEVTSLGTRCFSQCTGLTSVFIPDTVESIGDDCFIACTSLASVTIPDSIISIGRNCFWGCTVLLDYDLYWTGNDIISYDSYKMPNNTDTYFTIPQGETSNYVSKGYPTAKLLERGYTLTITADHDIIQTSETATVTAVLTYDDSVVSGETLSYEIKHGSTTITTGSDTTDSNGEIEIQYTGTSIGQVDVIITYDSLTKTYSLIDATFIDWGTDTQYTNWSYQNNITQSRSSSETTLSLTTAGTTGVKRLDNFNGDYCFEFDMKLETGNTYIQLRKDSSTKATISANTMGLGDNQYHHIKIEVEGSTVTVTSDGVEKSPITLSDTWNRFYLNLDANYDTVVKYKNFYYYTL